MKEEYFNQYVVVYLKNGKWYRDNERLQNIELANKRLKELKKQNKYEDYKIAFRKISKWNDLLIGGDED